MHATQQARRTIVAGPATTASRQVFVNISLTMATTRLELSAFLLPRHEETLPLLLPDHWQQVHQHPGFV